MRFEQRRRISHIALVALVALVSGCGVDVDTAPRDVPEGNRPILVNPSTQAVGSTTGSDRIYLLSPDAANEPHRLRATTRDVGASAQQRLSSLFGALTVAEVSTRLSTSIPVGLQLRSAQLNSDGTLVVDVSEQILALSTSALTDAVAQIVFTASEVQNVKRVELLVDGEIRQWPAADGGLQAAPLTVYDYPGFVESTQPNFPAVPSPG